MSVLQNTACTRRASVPLLALAFVQLASSAVSPALANMSQAFPEVSPAYIGMLSTLPSFLGIPCTLLCGKIVGRMVSYRTLAIGGMVISLVCGIAPAFTDSFPLMMLWRALFGMGYGIISPLMMPMVMANFHGEEIYRQTSMNAVSTNVGAVVFQLLGGYACSEAASYLNVFGSVGGFISSIVVTGIVQALGWQPGRPSFVVCMVGYCLMAAALFVGSLVKRVDPV